jgi:FAD-dependent urate hydroxylase
MDAQVVIVGAGPYGLAAASRLRRAGIDPRVFGDPMSFWREMPKGMFLRSNWTATSIAGHDDDELSLDAYLADTGERFSTPVPLDRFIAYGEWVQRRAAPDLDRRSVARVAPASEGFSVTLEDGEELRAGRVVVAGGIAPFAWRPPELVQLPAGLTSHTGDHSDLACFAERKVAIVGGGQSALESAALAREAGADVEVFVRSPRVVWLRGHGVKKRIGRLGPVVYAPTDVGPLWYSRLVSVPDLFRQLPRAAQDRIARRAIRPAGAHWLIGRLTDVPIHLGTPVAAVHSDGEAVELSADGTRFQRFDHLLLGTGYRVDVSKYSFLAPELLGLVRRSNGYPVLGPGLESSLPGLHFLGAPAAWSFGPIMRFVSGSWYSSRALVGRVADDDGHRAPAFRGPRASARRAGA